MSSCMTWTSECPFHSSDVEPGGHQRLLIRATCLPTLDRKESRPVVVTVLEAALDVARVAEPDVMDDHLRDEVTVVFVTLRGKAVVGDDGLRGRDAQDHGAIQSPHDELPARWDGAVETGLLAHQRRGVLGSFYDLVAGSRRWETTSESTLVRDRV